MRWTVFDFGEVISRRPTTIGDLADIVRADRVPFESAYWELRRDYDRGLPPAEYWSAVSTRAGGQTPTESDVTALTRDDVDGWLEVDPSTIELIQDLAADGCSLAVLSNAPAVFGGALRRQPWAVHFQQILISAELGSAKPDPQIWTVLQDRLDAAAGDCLFFDDRQVNVDAAVGAGIRAHRWAGAAAARDVIEEFYGDTR